MARLEKNPYGGVDWDSCGRYVGNLHCHTLMSDGRAMPDEVIEGYAAAGYRILALTDHDGYHTIREGEPEIEPTCETTWPWTEWIDAEPSRVWERDGMETSANYPEVGEGMLAIRGNEIKPSPELVSLFNDCGYDDWEEGRRDRLDYVRDRDGLSFWAHPMDYLPGGRWAHEFDDSFEAGLAFYREHLTAYRHNLGVEMQAKDPELALKLFDALVADLYADHDVFLYANDDSHTASVAENAMVNLVLAEDLTGPAVRSALERGRVLVGERSDHLPDVRRVAVDERRQTLLADVRNCDEITWVRDGDPVHSAAEFDYSAAAGSAVRFEVRTGDSTLYSQSFLVA